MNIGVIGAGHVGLVTAVCFAELANKVFCQDKDKEKIKIIKSNSLPFYEPELKSLLLKNQGKNLFFTYDLKELVLETEIIFICVGTPPLRTGQPNLSSVKEVIREIAQYSKGYKLIVEKSTVPVRTGEWLERIFKYHNKKNAEFDIASNPEFLREGCAVYDFFHPDRIVIGVKSKRAENLLKGIYKPIINHSFKCIFHKQSSFKKKVPFLVTDINSAEIIKHASNAFLSTKISFINMISDLCERTSADIKKVSLGIGLDKRIGRDFLEAGLGFGGFCFPKDLRAFIKIGESHNCNFSLLREVEKINEKRIEKVILKLKEKISNLKGKTIAILGLSFKPNTDDIRFSPAIKLIRALLVEKVKIKAYDPYAIPNVRKELKKEKNIIYNINPYETAKEADALIICTAWNEFKKLNYKKIKKLMRNPIIIDGRNLLSKEKMLALGFLYSGMGI